MYNQMNTQKVLRLPNVAEITGLTVNEIKDLIACGDLAALGTNKDLVRICDLNSFLGAEPSPIQNALKPVIENVGEEGNDMSAALYGEGSVYWNEKRKCFQAAFYLIENGIKKRKIVSGSTEIEAIGKMQMAKAAANGAVTQACFGSPVIITNSMTGKEKIKFSTVAEEYMRFAKQKNSDVTYRNKETTFKQLVPYFEDKFIDEITALDVQTFLNTYQIFKEGDRAGTTRSQAGIKNMYVFLKAIFNYADKSRGYIDRVPVFGVEVPKGIKSNKDDKVFHEAELVNIFRAACEHPLYLTVATLALGSGLRSEEFIALKWSDVDFENKTINVSRALIIQRNQNEKSKWGRKIGDTKTEASERVVSVGDITLNQLSAWKQYVRTNGLYEKALECGNSDYIFTNSKGQIRNQDHLRNNFKHYFIRRGIVDKSITFHKFRHSFATWARARGADGMAIKVWLGHSLKDDITLGTYTSLVGETEKISAKIIDDFIAGILKQAKTLGIMECINGRNGKACKK